MTAIRVNLNASPPLSCPTIRTLAGLVGEAEHKRASTMVVALAPLVAAAQQLLVTRKLALDDLREQLRLLDAQIGEFLRDETSQPPRDAGIFLCRMAMHLRVLADEMDGGRV